MVTRYVETVTAFGVAHSPENEQAAESAVYANTLSSVSADSSRSDQRSSSS